MRASIASQRHGPNRLIVEDANDLLQCDNDHDARVLINDVVIKASKFHRLRAVLGFLDGCRRLLERQVDADLVHGQVETHDVLDGHHVDGCIILLVEQLHCIFFLFYFSMSFLQTALAEFYSPLSTSMFLNCLSSRKKRSPMMTSTISVQMKNLYMSLSRSKW